MSYLTSLTRPTLAVPRNEGDIDVVAKVHEKLVEAGVGFANTWLDEKEIKEAKDQNPQLQCFLISRNLNFKLISTSSTRSEDNMAARACLGSLAAPEEFVDNLSTYVMPCLQKEYGTPQ